MRNRNRRSARRRFRPTITAFSFVFWSFFFFWFWCCRGFRFSRARIPIATPDRRSLVGSRFLFSHNFVAFVFFFFCFFLVWGGVEAGGGGVLGLPSFPLGLPEHDGRVFHWVQLVFLFMNEHGLALGFNGLTGFSRANMGFLWVSMGFLWDYMGLTDLYWVCTGFL